VKKILLIDDSKFIRTTVAFGLRKFGYEVIETASGEEGIIAATIRKPDLILLDIVMPNVDGFDVLRELKQDVVTKNIPVIMRTTQNKQELIVRAISMGACGYIVKPFEVNQIIGKIRKALRENGTSLIPESATCQTTVSA